MRFFTMNSMQQRLNGVVGTLLVLAVTGCATQTSAPRATQSVEPVVSAPAQAVTAPVAAPAPTPIHRVAGQPVKPPAPVVTPLAQPLAPIAEVAIDWAGQKASVVEAATSGKHPERLSNFVPATPFDLDRWKADPLGYATAYASIVEPSRAFTPAPPAANLPELTLTGPSYLEVAPLGQVRVRFTAVPYAPISAFAEDKGTFANGLCYTTVVANADGLADLLITAGPGVSNEVKVQCASPCVASAVTLTINVVEPLKKK